MPWSIQFVLQSRFMIYGKVGPLPRSRPTLSESSSGKGDESASVGWNLNVFLFADAEGGTMRGELQGVNPSNNTAKARIESPTTSMSSVPF